MCGIAGFFSRKLNNIDQICHRMLEPIHHRGPDDYGVWVDDCGMALGHKRLSVIDLSPLGHQPMISHCGRYVIVFNGEVYNFNQIKDELINGDYPYEFKGHSDTEAILVAISFWGIKKAISKFIGMFAFALWDKQERKLYLVRDRIGIKPLYYGFQGDSFVFGSELSAFKPHPNFKGEIDTNSLNLFFKYCYIPAPYSIYSGIFKLDPGSIVCLHYDDLINCNVPEPDVYWRAREVFDNGAKEQFSGSIGEAMEELERLLRDSIDLRMISDVPLGAFLSGGVDSSLVVALMQSMSSQKIKTFSIGFQEERFNEAKHAGAVARHLGTDHIEHYLTQKDLLDFIPRLNNYMDEPFGDSSIVPTYFVSKIARESVTVSLTGDGGDELFSGYGKYRGAIKGWDAVTKYPLLFRQASSKLIKQFDSEVLNVAGMPFSYPLRNFFNEDDSIGTKLSKLSEYFPEKSFGEFFRKCESTYRIDKSFVLGSEDLPTKHLLASGNLDKYQYMSMIDVNTYLVDDILTKVDRASMAVSLEARIPLLDHRIVEFAASIPTSYKVKDGNYKYILKQLLYKYVPSWLIDRPKQGFSMPVCIWLKDELKEHFEECIRPEKLINQGYLDHKIICKLWREFKEGKRDWEYTMWNIFIFQNWLEK